MDVGVLFDPYEPVARRFRDEIAAEGLKVALNEPYSGRNGLMYAAMRDDGTTVITMLLEAGADPSLKNDVGKTAFHIARENELLEAAARFDLLQAQN